MAKNVFKAVEVTQLGKPVKLDRPTVVVVNRIDDEQEKLRKLLKEQGLIKEENKLLVAKAQEEAASILAAAREEAARIVKEAEEQAFRHMQSAVEKAKLKEAEVFAQREKEIRAREEEARQLMERVRREVEDLREEASKKGYKEGYQAGYESGRAEMERLIDRLKVIIQAAIDKRREIVEDSEEQIVRIILLMARKVVKHITAKDEEVVVRNIKAALERVRGKEQIVIRVNSQDLQMATEHKEEFIAMLEEVKSLRILEDDRVDRGGCIIETDFGAVDARIASQLEELEEKVREATRTTMFDPLVGPPRAGEGGS